MKYNPSRNMKFPNISSFNTLSILHQKSHKSEKIFVIVSFLLLICLIPCNSLGEVFSSPSQNEFNIITYTTYLQFTSNTTIIIPYPVEMIRQPTIFLSYKTFILDQYIPITPEKLNWFYIISANTTLTNTIVTNNNGPDQSNNSPMLQYHTFDLMISCVDSKYFQIINWQYAGPRLGQDDEYFTVQFASDPIPFSYCYADATNTSRQYVNWVMAFNGVIGANVLTFTRNGAKYADKATMHIYKSKPPFYAYFFSDHLWVDTFFIGFIFFCPNSYVMKQKYTAQMVFAFVGYQNLCQNYSDYATTYFNLTQNYNYKYMIGMRFVLPCSSSAVCNVTYSFQFDITAGSNLTQRFYNVMGTYCGRVQYTIFFLAQKKCQGYRELQFVNYTCQCNNSNYFYDIGVITCEFICPNGLVNANYSCRTCQQLFGSLCNSCTNISCLSCQQSLLVNGSCICENDRALSISGCQLCSTLFSSCSTCTSLICLSCLPNYQYIPSSNPSCINCKTIFNNQCANCSATKCLSCLNNFTIQLNGTCTCPQDNYVNVAGDCLSIILTYGLNCALANMSNCTACTNNFTLQNGTCICHLPYYLFNNSQCLACIATYGAQCLTCNSNYCLSCNSGYKLFNGNTCFSCTNAFGLLCLDCSQTTCLSCNNSYFVQANGSCNCPAQSLGYTLTITGQCASCMSIYSAFCSQCNNTNCIKCKTNFVLASNSTSCTCINDRFFSSWDQTCKLCSIYSGQCLTCNSSQCLSCQSGYKLFPLNTINSCSSCSINFGINCIDCTQIKCLTCDNNFLISPNNLSCYCPQSLGYFISSSNKCELCTNNFNSKCLQCTEVSCLRCSNNYILQQNSTTNSCSCIIDRFIDINDGTCNICNTVYGAQCKTCNSSKCLSCLSSYQLFATKIPSCLLCNLVFGDTCIQCDATKCLNCINGSTPNLSTGICQCSSPHVLSSNNLCQSCQSLYDQYCKTCNSTQCIACSLNFVLNNSNYCQCLNDRYLDVNGSCNLCSLKYGSLCLTCNSNFCISCPINYILHSSNIPYCFTCRELYGLNCDECSSFQCLLCKNGYSLSENKTSCECSSMIRILSTLNSSCIECSAQYSIFCTKCDNFTCLNCSNNYYLSENRTNCLCQIDRFEFSGGAQCYLCQDVYGVGCIECNNLICIKCNENWSLKPDGNCYCQSPNQIQIKYDNISLVSSNICRSCQFLYGVDNCSLLITQKYLQIGQSAYIQISFNHPYSQITELISLQNNTQAFLNEQLLSEVQWHKDLWLLKVDLVDTVILNSTLFIRVANSNYLKWHNFSLSNELSGIPLNIYDRSSTILISIIEEISNILQYIFPLVILFSLGTFNNGFQLWIILSLYIYICNNEISGFTIEILSKLNQIQYFQLMKPETLPHLLIQHKNIDFKEKIYKKNQDIVSLASQVIILYSISVVFCLYLKNYMVKKNFVTKYSAYVNYLRHFKQYTISNFYSLYGILAFSIAIQFESLVNSNWEINNLAIFINTIISGSILIILLFMPLFNFNLFPFLTQQISQTYSVIYQKVHPTNGFQFVEYVIRVFHVPIFVIVIWTTRDITNSNNLIGQFSLIGITLINVTLCIINFRHYISKLFWIVKFLKRILLLCFQIFFLLMTSLEQKNKNHQNSSSWSVPVESTKSYIDDHINIDLTCTILIVILVLYEYFELIVKLIYTIAINKLSISEYYFDHKITNLIQITEDIQQQRPT